MPTVSYSKTGYVFEMQSVADNVIIRIGMDSPRAPIIDSGLPLLVSANSLWRQESKRFSGFKRYINKDVALDSSGFVAMKLYGGYRWTHDQYAQLAKAIRPTWWAQMDFCCEPDIASSPEQVSSRIEMTIRGLNECRSSAKRLGIENPIPVLQGWLPSEYVSGPIFGNLRNIKMIGVGSVCRRRLTGRDGLIAVIDAIDRKLSKNICLHLFGVKGDSLAFIIREFGGRKFSADSMAYSFRARCHAREIGVKCDNAMRGSFAMKWISRTRKQISKQHQPKFKFV